MDDRKVISVIKKATPAVVSIAVRKHLEDVEKDLSPDQYPFLPTTPDKKKVEIPEDFADEKGMVEIGGGSGFIVRGEGLILTNRHIIGDRKAEYVAILNDERRFPVTLLSRDPVNDVAIIKIDAGNLPTLPLGDATRLELGQSVIAVGNALGIFKNTVSLGIVSGLSRSITAQIDTDAPYQEMRGLIQTDAAINPGNSGGPLVDLEGKVVGINVAVVSGAQNISFAIPINAVERDLQDLKKYGRIRRPLLGVRYILIDDALKAKTGLPVGYGAFVTNEGPGDSGVVPGSPAEKAGLKERDIILELNKQKIDRDHSIQDILENLDVGKEVDLLVFRDGKELTLKAALAEKK
ncbi:PDZ domain-containing protein [Candidatus Parcubacteria bacterium]|nr:MAG: PDZ domain-containing protein [Candidatus Parcubacteria bacterium]